MRNAWANAVALRSEKSVGCTIERMAVIFNAHVRVRVRFGEIQSAQATNSVCSLPRLRGGGVGEGVTCNALSYCVPPPRPSPASGGGDDVAPPIVTADPAALHSRRFEERTDACAARRSYTGISI